MLPVAIVIDAVSPTVNNITSTTLNGAYGIAQTIPIFVTFNKAVTVTGTPTLTLETGLVDRVIAYTSGSGTNTIRFNYALSGNFNNRRKVYINFAQMLCGKFKIFRVGD